MVSRDRLFLKLCTSRGICCVNPHTGVSKCHCAVLHTSHTRSCHRTDPSAWSVGMELLNRHLCSRSPQSRPPCLFSPGAPLGPSTTLFFTSPRCTYPSKTILLICFLTCCLSPSKDCKLHEGRDFGCFVHCCTPSPSSSTWYLADMKYILPEL